MGFREKMAAKKADLQKRHTTVEKEGQRKYGTIFLLEKIPKEITFWRPGIGEHDIDIIPFIIGSQHPNQNLKALEDIHFCVRLFVYMRVGATEDPYVSPYDNWNDPDPIREWMQSKGRLPKDQYKKTASKERCAFFIWCHDTPEEEAKGLRIWEESAFNSFDKIQEQSKLPKGGGHIPFSDWDNGSRLYFDKTEESYMDDDGKTQKGTKFSAFKFLDRPTDQKKIPDNILDMAMDNHLDEFILMHPPYEVLYKAHHGVAFKGTTPEADETAEIEHKQAAADEPTRSSDDGDASGEEKLIEKQDVAEGECPYGHEYGHAEDFPECNGCEVWDACMAYEQKMNAPDASEEKVPDPVAEKEAEVEKETSKDTDKKRPPRRPPRRT